jgi:replicative superfamily II helicase
MKHVGKMKNNSARVAVVFRTVPNEPNNALVVGTSGLPDAYHDALMSVIESDVGQQANELADVLASRRFPDGEIMLQWLHTRGQLKKVPTNLVLMTPNTQTAIPLDQVNQAIADSKGITVEELATPGGTKTAEPKAKSATRSEEIIVDAIESPIIDNTPVTPSDLRSMADKLFKEAQALRRKADELDPPVKKAKPVKAEA